MAQEDKLLTTKYPDGTIAWGYSGTCSDRKISLVEPKFDSTISFLRNGSYWLLLDRVIKTYSGMVQYKPSYSIRKLLIGFASDAFTLRNPTVIKATIKVIRIASKKMPAPSSMR